MTAILRSTFCQQRSFEMQCAFDGIKLLDNATQFEPKLASKQGPKVSSGATLEVMDHLDRELLLNGNMVFIQHPVSVDHDRSDAFETRKVMVGFKANVKGYEAMTFLHVMNKPMNQKLKVFMDGARQQIPSVFDKNDVFYGGIDETKIHLMTTNPNCGGFPMLNETVFLDPDRNRAQELILKREAKTSDFRFFIGFMSRADCHLQNILDRKKYIAVNVSEVSDRGLVRNILWNNEQMVREKYLRNDMWRQMVQCLTEEVAQSWLKLPDTILDSEMFHNLSKGHNAHMDATFQEAGKQVTDFIL